MLLVNFWYGAAHLLALTTFATHPAAERKEEYCFEVFFSATGYFAIMFVESLVIAVTGYSIRHGQLSERAERTTQVVAITMGVLAGAGMSTYCGVRCIDPDDGFFTDCRHHLWDIGGKIWLTMLIIPVVAFTTLCVIVHRINKNLVYNPDPTLMTRAEIDRGMRVVEMRRTAVKEMFNPLRWYPVQFIIFGLVVLIHFWNNSRTWDVFYALKTFATVIIFFATSDDGWSLLRRWRNPSRQRSRRRVRLDPNPQTYDYSALGDSVGYVPFEDAVAAQEKDELPGPEHGEVLRPAPRNHDKGADVEIYNRVDVW